MNVKQIIASEISVVDRNSLFRDDFIQLSGALLLSFLLPTFAFQLFGWELLPTAQLEIYFSIAFMVMLGHYFFRRLISFPGARSSSYILPIFSSAFILSIAIMFFLRADYNRSYIILSYVACIGWYFLRHFMGNRARKLRLAVIPLGKAINAGQIKSIDWLWLRDELLDLPDCDGIVVDFRSKLSDHWERFVAERAITGMPVYHFKQIEESVTGRVDIEHLSENNFGSLIPGIAYIKIKQWIDMASALVIGVALLPMLLAIAIAIKIDSPGPALFRQRRMGYRGKSITVFKFRTMAHRPFEQIESRETAITQTGDARITRLGQLLRRTRIDELPQIVNILRGQMSWIGPRPEVCALSEWYESEIPFYRYRHIVRPGITGWAQVNQGHVGDVEKVHIKLQFDFYYIKYFSPWLDALIVMRTIRTMLTGYGSK